MINLWPKTKSFSVLVIDEGQINAQVLFKHYLKKRLRIDPFYLECTSSDLQHEQKRASTNENPWTWKYAIYHWILEQSKPETDAIHKAEVCGWFCDEVSIWTWSLSLSTTVVTLNRAPSNFSTRPDRSILHWCPVECSRMGLLLRASINFIIL